MALHKLVMKRGSYFKGYKLNVSATTGDYVLHIDKTNLQWFVNSVQLVPDDSGAGDYFTIAHYDTTTGGNLVRTLGDTIYNLGPRLGFELGHLNCNLREFHDEEFKAKEFFPIQNINPISNEEREKRKYLKYKFQKSLNYFPKKEAEQFCIKHGLNPEQWNLEKQFNQFK